MDILEVVKIKEYYNQEFIAKEISKETGYNISDVNNILNTLSKIMINKMSETSNETEIKICSGIKILAKIKDLRDFNSNLNIKSAYEKIMIYPKITDDFKNKINNKYKEKQLN